MLPPVLDPDADTAARWRELLRQVGEDAAAPLTAAIERVQRLARTGRIERSHLRALQAELEAARRAAIAAQQLVRLETASRRPAQERVALTSALQAVLTQRADQTQARQIQLRQVSAPIEVQVDAALLYALCNALLDWALMHARSAIELRVESAPWPAQARLQCRFAWSLPDERRAGARHQPADTISWRLVEHTAAAMGLHLRRDDQDGATRLTLEFPCGADTLPLVGTFDREAAPDARPFAGSQILVVAASRELRSQLREAIRHLGLIVDAARSLAEAAEYCRNGPPHAVIYESALADARFADWRAALRRDLPELAFIEVVDHGDALDWSGADASRTIRIGRAALAAALPAALLSELAKAL